MEEGKLSKKDIKIVIAAHKPYRMPEDTMYVPLHVGAEGKKNPDGTPLDLGYQKDNEGDNIAAKNPNYCELTGIYYAWKIGVILKGKIKVRILLRVSLLNQRWRRSLRRTV